MSFGASHDVAACVLARLPRLYTHTTPEQFFRNSLEVARELVPGEWHGFNVIAPSYVHTLVSPITSELLDAMPAFDRNVAEHPFMRYWQVHPTGCPAISDLMSVEDFHRTTLYDEFYRRFPQEDQLSLAQVKPDGVVAVTVGRSHRGFTDDERSAFQLLRPHILQAYSNLLMVRAEVAQAARDSILPEAAGLRLATIYLDPGGRPTSYGPYAEEMLARFFSGARKRTSAELPNAVRDWLQPQLRLRAESNASEMLHEPLLRELDGLQLCIRLVRLDCGDLMLQLTERPRPDAILRRLKALPPRVRRVLDLLLAGLSEKQVAAELQLSRHTVHEYVKRLYAQLEVNTRAELLTNLLPYQRMI